MTLWNSTWSRATRARPRRTSPRFDPADHLRDALEGEGIRIHAGVQTERVERSDAGAILHVSVAGRSEEIRAERILVATGRRARTSDLGLAEAGVDMDQAGFIRTDGTMRTTRPTVFASGEVAGLPGFVYVAAAAGRIAAQNALLESGEKLDLRAVPRVVFPSPQVAAVGMSPHEAEAHGLSIEIGTLDLSHLPRAAVEHQSSGWIRIVAEAGSGRLLGMQAVAPNAAELLRVTFRVRSGTRE